MTVLKVLILIAVALVMIKFVASIFGKGDIPILNQLVTGILTLFVTFEVFKLGQALIGKFG
jgi:hypothetical protein